MKVKKEIRVNKIILALMCLALLSGCQSREDASQPQAQNVASDRRDAAKKLVAQAIVFLENKDIKGAVTALEDAIKIDPTDPDSYLLLGQILLKAEQFEQAAELLDQAGKMFPDNGTVFYMMSVSNKMAGRKLPAVLAARHSFDIFKAANDAENAQKSAALLEEVIASPDTMAPAVVPAKGAAAAPMRK